MTISTINWPEVTLKLMFFDFNETCQNRPVHRMEQIEAGVVLKILRGVEI